MTNAGTLRPGALGGGAAGAGAGGGVTMLMTSACRIASCAIFYGPWSSIDLDPR